jgi:hypothetical protein
MTNSAVLEEALSTWFSRKGRRGKPLPKPRTEAEIREEMTASAAEEFTEGFQHVLRGIVESKEGLLFVAQAFKESALAQELARKDRQKKAKKK